MLREYNKGLSAFCSFVKKWFPLASKNAASHADTAKKSPKLKHLLDEIKPAST
jgi:hypothetical protein